MPSTPSSASRVSVSNGAARRTTSSSSSTVIRSASVIATICWASTSSGLRGITVGSMRPRCMPFDDDRGLEQVAAVLREDDALRRLADLVAGAANALETARDRRRALDLDDEVDGAHVDAELQRARGHEGRQPAGLELLLDLETLLAGDRPVVGADQLLAGELVEALGQALARGGGCS